MHLFKRLTCPHTHTTLCHKGSWVETETLVPTSYRERTRVLVFQCDQCAKQLTKKEVHVSPTRRKAIVFVDCIKQKAR